MGNPILMFAATIIGATCVAALIVILIFHEWRHPEVSTQRLNGQQNEEDAVIDFVVRVDTEHFMRVTATSQANAERVALREVRRKEARRKPPEPPVRLDLGGYLRGR